MSTSKMIQLALFQLTQTQQATFHCWVKKAKQIMCIYIMDKTKKIKETKRKAKPRVESLIKSFLNS